MSFAIYPKYVNVYEGQTPSITELLKDIPSQFIINVACYINAEKYLNFLDLKIDFKLLGKLTERLDISVRTSIYTALENFSTNIIMEKQQVTIFPLPSMLRLIEHEMVHFKTGGFTQITPEQEENILKAILILNQLEEDGYIHEAKKRKIEGAFATFINWVWPNLLPIMEFQGRKEILLPLHYSIKFFKYLNSVEKFKPYLDAYFAKSNVSSYTEYLRKLVECYIRGFDNTDQRFHFKFDSSILEVNSVINGYILDMQSFDSTTYIEKELHKNFKQLREKPIIKFSDNSFCITNWNFFVDKYYQAQKFDFYNISGIQEIYNGDDNQKFQAFNGEIGRDFNEKYVFLETMHQYLSLSGGKIVEEDKTKGWNQDLYYRFENHVCFVEFKTVALPVSTDFDEIKKGVDHKDKLMKAVKQLVQQIKSFSDNINKFENLTELGLKKEALFIYPSIVYTDIGWSTYGITEYFNTIFREEIKKENLKFFSISDIVMIHIDFFYEYEKIFLEDKVSFHLLLWKHYMQRAIYMEQFKKIPNADTAMQMYADSKFYLQKAFKGKYSNVLQSSLFELIIKELGITNTTGNA